MCRFARPQAGGKAETAARIAKGLDALRANYSRALGEQEEAMRTTVLPSSLGLKSHCLCMFFSAGCRLLQYEIPKLC